MKNAKSVDKTVAQSFSDKDAGTPMRADFLARHGLGGVPLDPLAQDASARHYFRLVGSGLMLMEDDPSGASFAAYLRVAEHLSALGLSAPAIKAVDRAHGLALITDFGTGTYNNLLQQGHDEAALYELAIDTLLYLHAHPQALEIDVPRYDMPVLLEELERFTRWFVPAISPEHDQEAFQERFLRLWRQALQPVAGQHVTLVLRDFHIDNLMILPERQGVQACGLLDFQDAIIGPAEYDLVSLLQDARRDLAPGLEERMLARYLAGRPAAGASETDLRQAYYILGAQRHARIAGVFVRLWQRDNKTHYLRHMPRILGQFSAALDAAGLGAIRDFLDEELPDWQNKGAALAAYAQT